jgi:hypothetical protein
MGSRGRERRQARSEFGESKLEMHTQRENENRPTIVIVRRIDRFLKIARDEDALQTAGPPSVAQVNAERLDDGRLHDRSIVTAVTIKKVFPLVGESARVTLTSSGKLAISGCCGNSCREHRTCFKR